MSQSEERVELDKIKATESKSEVEIDLSKPTQRGIGDYVEIVYHGKIFLCEILDKSEGMFVLYDLNNHIRTTITQKDTKWILPNNEVATKVNFINESENIFNNNYEYEKIFLLETLPYAEFKNLSVANKFYYNLCNGKHSERIYETRSRKEFEEPILALRTFTSSVSTSQTNPLTWKEFYERVIEFKNGDVTQYDYVDNQFRNNNILELQLLFLKRHILYGLAQWAVGQNNILLLDWMKEQKVDFSIISIQRMLIKHAIYSGSLDVLKWLHSLNSNIVLTAQYLEMAIEQNQRHIINWFHDNGIFEN